MTSPTPPVPLTQADIRRQRRVVAAVRRWQSKPDRSVEKEKAFRSMEFTRRGPWCAAWAGNIDLEANGGPSRLYRQGYSVSCTRRCVWAPRGSGVNRKTGKVDRPALGPEYAPRPAREAQAGDIVTIGRMRSRGRWAQDGGEHCTIVIHRAADGCLCIGGNQHGEGPGGEQVTGGVALTWYPFDGPGMRVQWVVSIPDSEYPTVVAPASSELDAVRALVAARGARR